jgi:hypothetical protein
VLALDPAIACAVVVPALFLEDDGVSVVHDGSSSKSCSIKRNKLRRRNLKLIVWMIAPSLFSCLIKERDFLRLLLLLDQREELLEYL